MFDRVVKHSDAFSGVAYRDVPQSLTIIRDFSAPRERVWRAWTQPDAIIRWHGPKFYPAVEVCADVRVEELGALA